MGVATTALSLFIFPGRRDVNFFATGCADFSESVGFLSDFSASAHKKTRRGPLKLPARPAASHAATLPKGAAAPETYYACGNCQTAVIEVQYFNSYRCCQGPLNGIVTAVGVRCRRESTHQTIAMRLESNVLPRSNNLIEFGYGRRRREL